MRLFKTLLPRISRQRGSTAFFAILFVLLLGTMAGILSNLVSVVSLGSAQMQHGEKMRAEEAVHMTVLADVTADMAVGGILAHGGAELVQRFERISSMLTVSSGIISPGYALSRFEVTPLPASIFSKANPLSPAGSELVYHPLAAAGGYNHIQTISGTFKISQKKASQAFSFSARLRETPSTEYGFLCTESYAPSSVGIVVRGTTVLMQGFSDEASGSVRLSTDYLVAPKGQIAGRITATRAWVNPSYRLSFGSAGASWLMENQNHRAPWNSQAFFDQATHVVTLQNGVCYQQVSGVEHRIFPNGGPKRVVVRLPSLVGAATRLYINCVTPADKAAGVVIIGDGGILSNPSKFVVTNGALWLWSSNITPCIVGTNYGLVTLTDGTWSEEGGGNAALAMSWVGHVSCPVSTQFSTPQAAAGAKLTLMGSLMCGQPSGNLTTIDITEARGTILRNMAPRVLYLYGLH